MHACYVCRYVYICSYASYWKRWKARSQQCHASVLSSLGHLWGKPRQQQTVDYLFTLLSVILKSVAGGAYTCIGLEPESTPPSFEMVQQRKCPVGFATLYDLTFIHGALKMDDTHPLRLQIATVSHECSFVVYFAFTTSRQMTNPANSMRTTPNCSSYNRSSCDRSSPSSFGFDELQRNWMLVGLAHELGLQRFVFGCAVPAFWRHLSHLHRSHGSRLRGSRLRHLWGKPRQQQTVDYLFTLLSVILKSVAGCTCKGLEPESIASWLQLGVKQTTPSCPVHLSKKGARLFCLLRHLGMLCRIGGHPFGGLDRRGVLSVLGSNESWAHVLLADSTVKERQGIGAWNPLSSWSVGSK